MSQRVMVDEATSLGMLSEVSAVALVTESRESAAELLPIGTLRPADRPGARLPGAAGQRLALRGVLGEAWQLQLIGSEDHHRARHAKSIKGTNLKKGRHVARQELRELFAACAADPGIGARRVAAMLVVLYGAGLRRAEVVALDWADFTLVHPRACGEREIYGADPDGEFGSSLSAHYQQERS